MAEITFISTVKMLVLHLLDAAIRTLKLRLVNHPAEDSTQVSFHCMTTTSRTTFPATVPDFVPAQASSVVRIRESKLLAEQKSQTRNLEVMDGMSTELVMEDGDDLKQWFSRVWFQDPPLPIMTSRNQKSRNILSFSNLFNKKIVHRFTPEIVE